jgi:hypothetical protein
VLLERKIVRDAWNILMLSARRHVQNKDTQENSSMGQGVRSQRKKVLRGLHLRNSLKVQLGATRIQNYADDAKMRPTMRLSVTQQDSLHVNFCDPTEGKLIVFFTF